MYRDELLEELTILDFEAVDLALFLNIHSNDREALKEYNKRVLKADKLRHEFVEKYGQLCSFRSYADEEWTWNDEPWPWEYDFFSKKMDGECM